MIEVSPDAATFVRDLRDREGKGDHLLRIAARRRGDGAGLNLALVPAAEPGDEVGESNGVVVCIAPDLSGELDNKLLDLEDTGVAKGLVLRAT